MGKRSFVAIEIDKSYLKICQANVGGKDFTVTKLIIEGISGLAEDEISKVLAELMNHHHIRPENITSVVSRERLMVRYLRLPSTQQHEVESMISFEASKQIPYSKDEVITDYRLAGASSEGYSDVILVVMHKNELERIENIFSSIHKKPFRIRMGSEAMAGLLSYVLKGEDLSAKDICVVDIDADGTDVSVISHGRLAFTRVIPMSGLALMNNQDYESQVKAISEITNSLSMYEKEKALSQSGITEYIITGAAGYAEGLSNAIKAELGVSVRYINMVPAINLADNAFTEDGIPGDCSVSALIGSLIMSEGINLVPDQEKAREKVQVRVKRAVLAFIIFASAVMLLLGGAFYNMQQKKRLLEEISLMLKDVEPAAEAVESKLKKLQLIKGQFSEGSSSLDVIYNLYKIMPGNISLVDFNYEESSRVVRLRGTANTMSEVFGLAGILEKSEKFKDVQARSVGNRRSKEGDVVDFQLSCIFVP